jgi:serine/threonine protein kinase/predicted ATPase
VYHSQRILRKPVERIASRYRIEECLGRGGMASVYRVFDESAAKHVALKLLSKEASEKSNDVSLFEREFYTLAQLAHPRIIEVYDYGVSENGAYYTMEYLDGTDFRGLAPLEWKKACALLRDLASSLALLHSRRLLHRDISSRNARCTKDGRAKLIDFGAMIPFGTASKIIGTPAFVAPEALNHQPLDQRTDLYALGALAYWLITRRYAYRSHSLNQLNEAWRVPPVPLGELTPDIPKALNDLVMSLLSLDRMARPFNATEVVEILSACAGLAPDEAPEVRQAYLTTPQLVGRDAIRAELRQRIVGLMNNQKGDTLLLEGPSGIGRSRLLAELELEGKVVGATVLAARPTPNASADYGVVWKLIEQTFEAMHGVAVETIKPHLPVLDGLFPDLAALIYSRGARKNADAFGDSSYSSEVTGALGGGNEDSHVLDHPPAAPSASRRPSASPTRPQIQKALLEWFLAISKKRRYIMTIDDIHHVDEPSAALLSALASESRHHLFILGVSVEAGVESNAPAPLAFFLRTASRIAIGPLDLGAIKGLLRSVFGDAPNVRLLADRIYAVSKGNPRETMELAQHLVDRKIVRYQSGGWKLPVAIDESDLPHSLTEALRLKAHPLDAAALELARTMALSSDQWFSIEECAVLAGHSDTARLTLALNELVASEVLAARGAYYALSHPAWISALNEGLEGGVQRDRHLRLAEVFGRRGNKRLQDVLHLLGAGQEERALDRFLVEYQEIRRRLSQNPQTYSEYRISLPRERNAIFEELIAICRRLGRPQKQIFFLRGALVAFDSNNIVDKTHLIELINGLYRESGLADYEALSESGDDSKRLWRALQLAQERYDATPDSERVFPPTEAIRELAQALLLAISVTATSLDISFYEFLPSLGPLVQLSPALSIIEKNVQSTRRLLISHSELAWKGYLEILARITEPDHAGIPESVYEGARLSTINAIGLLEASKGVATALERVEQLDLDPLFQVNAWRIRLIYYLRRGEMQKAEQCQKRLELLQIQNSPAQFFEGTHLYPVLLSYCLMDDLTGVGQTIEGIEKMANQFSGWRPVLHFAQGEYQRIRGDYASALKEHQKVVAHIGPGHHIIWPYAAAAHIKTLLELDRCQEAHTEGWRYLKAADPQDFSYVRHFIAVPLAVIEARLGNEDSAINLSTDAIDHWNALGVTGVTLGLAYEARARVAIYTDDPKNFRSYAKLCQQQYRVGEVPALAAKYQKMEQDARQAFAGPSFEIKKQSETVISGITEASKDPFGPRTESRYVFDGVLGEGGAASVYKVRDCETGKYLALKRARVTLPGAPAGAEDTDEKLKRKKRLEGMLRREYQTLKSLAHPHTVEVYDFGVDTDGPYYTMELLDGADLKELVPLEWEKACELLRDLASALAFLHSRRLLHRDVSPRNVRLTADGRVKLMDFGSMASMGTPVDVIGTPPFMPPETIYRQRLDQRSDLYSLGALAYLLLTGAHAYPVRHPNELIDAWRDRPPAPSELVAKLETLDELPEALDRLVMSLLSLDPLARPTSAAEVMERLSAIAGLPVDEQLAVPQAYLTTPTLVGRREALLAVRKRVIRSLRQRGRALLIRGPEGVGRSRFLDACAMEGKLAGLAVIRAEARDAQAGPYAVARTLAQQLLSQIPDIAGQEVKPYKATLESVIAESFPFASETNPPQVTPADRAVETPPSVESSSSRRPQIQQALIEWIRAISLRRALMITVDDIHRIDEPSLAFLALLSHQLSDRMAVLAVTIQSDATSPWENALKVIARAGTTIELENLTVDEVERLLNSVFGDSPNLRFVAGRIHETSEGNPAEIMQLARYLVDRGAVRYQSGAWSLPSSLDSDILPSNVREALTARLKTLDASAVRLARAMALSLEPWFSFEHCTTLATDHDPARVMHDLDTLATAEILSTDGKTYGFLHPRWATVLLDGVTEEENRALHRAIVELFEGPIPDTFRLAQHLLHAGQDERALEVFVQYSENLRERYAKDRDAIVELIHYPPREWNNTVSKLLRICEGKTRSKYRIYLINHISAMLGSVSVLPDTSYIVAATQQLYHDSGLDIYRELGDEGEPQSRMMRALTLAQQRYDASSEAEQVLAPGPAIIDLSQICLITLSVAGTSCDIGLIESLPSVRPLAALIPAFSVLEQNIENTSHLLAGRAERARQGYMEILERIAQPDHAGLSGEFVSSVPSAVRWAVAMVDASWGLASALAWADQLETEPSFKLHAWRIRMLHHLRKGDVQKAGECKRQVDILKLQNSVQYFEGNQLLSEACVYSFSNDLISARRVVDEIAKMAELFNGWTPTLHFARAEYHRIRGDYASARHECEHALAVIKAGRHIVWPYVAGAYINTLYEAGCIAESQIAGREMIAQAEAADLGICCNYIRVPLARSEAEIGEIDVATHLADVTIDTWKGRGTSGLNLGLAYEVRARVAVRAGNREDFRTFAKLCAEQYPTGINPSLAARYAALIGEAEAEGLVDAAPERLPFNIERKLNTQESSMDFGVQMHDIADSHKRAERILETLAVHCGASDGYLFGLQRKSVALLSSLQRGDVSVELTRLVETYLESELADSYTATITAADEAAAYGNSRSWVLGDGKRFQPVLLYAAEGDRMLVVGIAVLAPREHSLKSVPPQLIHHISRTLINCRDVIPRYAAI